MRAAFTSTRPLRTDVALAVGQSGTESYIASDSVRSRASSLLAFVQVPDLLATVFDNQHLTVCLQA